MGLMSGFFFSIPDGEVACVQAKRPDVWTEYVSTGHPRVGEGPRSVYQDWFEWAVTHGSSEFSAYDQSEWLYMIAIGCSGRTWFASASDAAIEGLWQPNPSIESYYRDAGWFNDVLSIGRPVTRGVMRMCLNDWVNRLGNGLPAYDGGGVTPMPPGGVPPGGGGGTAPPPGGGGGTAPPPGAPNPADALQGAFDWAKRNPLIAASAVIGGILLFSRSRR